MAKCKNEKIGEIIMEVYRELREKDVLIIWDNCDSLIASP